MKKNATSAELKARARASLIGHYLSLSGAYLLLIILQYFIIVPDTLLQISPPAGMLVYYAANFLIEVFFGIFKSGIAFLFLSNACGQTVSSSGLFTGFWRSPGKAMQIQLVPSLLLLLPNVLPQILLSQYLATQNTQYLLIGLIISLLFLPYVFFVEILFSQAYFVMLDFPDMNAWECLRTSCRLMKGNKLRYLYVRLSFIPMLLLGFFSCGLGLLYVYPYREQTFANFYLDLMEKKRSEAYGRGETV